MDVTSRTRIAYAVAARDIADQYRATVELAVDDFTPGALAATAHRLRRMSLMAQDRAVLAERAAGATWHEIAAALELGVDDVIARYERAYEIWVQAGDTVGFLPGPSTVFPHYGRMHDDNTADTVCALDQWRQRHADPWDTPTDAQYELLL